jgi:hypothetical protein
MLQKSRVQTITETLTCHTHIMDKKQSDDAAELKLFRGFDVFNTPTASFVSKDASTAIVAVMETVIVKVFGSKYIENTFSVHK